MLFYSLLMVVSLFLNAAFSQNPDNSEVSAVDGFVFDGPTGSSIPNAAQRTTSTTASSARTSTSTTTMSALREAEYNTCVTSCPVTTEYNPVCGSDNLDYTNPGGLGCAERCGKDVTLSHYGRCSIGTAG
ncbi:hypothetical protein HN011_010616 [Eciton burchellii]|nr:hypothetical protein HN011_010616 [Eciton burchellii]